MKQHAADAGRKLVAVAILLLAAFLVFKLVLGVVSTVIWVAVAVVALFAVIWALWALRVL